VARGSTDFRKARVAGTALPGGGLHQAANPAPPSEGRTRRVGLLERYRVVHVGQLLCGGIDVGRQRNGAR
jgi:hypothetical protein